jgi:hypothetical protein
VVEVAAVVVGGETADVVEDVLVGAGVVVVVFEPPSAVVESTVPDVHPAATRATATSPAIPCHVIPPAYRRPSRHKIPDTGRLMFDRYWNAASS